MFSAVIAFCSPLIPTAWEGFRYGIAYRLAEEYRFNPMQMMLDFIANGTPVAIHVPQR